MNQKRPYWTGSKLSLSLYPRIKNDLDFLLMRLFKADSGHKAKCSRTFRSAP